MTCDQTLVDIEPIQQILRMPGILAGDHIDPLQNIQRPHRNIIEIADWSGDHDRVLMPTSVYASQPRDKRSSPEPNRHFSPIYGDFYHCDRFSCRFASTFRAMMLPIPEKSNENHPIDRVGTVSAT
jgi:hypothetical protein